MFVSVALLAVVVGALVISPAARSQVDASTRRQDKPFVSLFFADPTTARSCPSSAGHQQVRFAVTSYLASADDVAWHVNVTERGGRVHRWTGALPTQPGLTSVESVVVRVPSRQTYSIGVSLPGRTESLLVHCGGGDA